MKVWKFYLFFRSPPFLAFPVRFSSPSFATVLLLSFRSGPVLLLSFRFGPVRFPLFCYGSVLPWFGMMMICGCMG
ncbi:hypothetical protein MtrunA17_Chr4g0013991 [Medicago truncatula]|uniref:Transmembrane protein n=1 Tax=Medicago truncatula TaxID=3880 RepID=A0A396I1K4_MEDTR|nr:hypothetical protein MtrunA17_Chr4g0013991 [Medicago truncatula]